MDAYIFRTPFSSHYLVSKDSLHMLSSVPDTSIPPCSFGDQMGCPMADPINTDACTTELSSKSESYIRQRKIGLEEVGM